MIISFLAVFIWQQTALSLYTLQALGVLMVLLIILSIKRKRISVQDQGINPFTTFGEDSPWTIFIFNTIVLLFVFATDGFTSPFFFLIYFLAFGVAFFLDPSTVFVFTVGTIAIFFPDALKNDVWGNMFKLASIALITPLSYFFGRSTKSQIAQTQKNEAVKDDAETITKDVASVLTNEDKTLLHEDKAKLKEALRTSEKIKEDVENE